MRELVDKQLMLEDVKSWVAMDSYEQHLINNMSAWIENLPTVEVSDEDCISRRVALDIYDDYNVAVENGELEAYRKYRKRLLELPSAQAEIISCRDCKFAHITNDRRYCKFCDMFTGDYGQLIEMYFDSNFYCGYAERRKHER